LVIDVEGHSFFSLSFVHDATCPDAIIGRKEVSGGETILDVADDLDRATVT
jgi:hypothetical protein